jgi:uncharacterized membrane protein YfcA
LNELDILLVVAVVFLALFTQSLSGFGLSLVSMPLLVPVLGIQTATPFIAVIALVGEIILLVYYRESLNIRVVWRLALASIIATPLGVFLLQSAPERLVLTLLGVIVAGYALYALFKFRLPRLEHSVWAYLAGFLAGLLGGAYNTSGPPVILYGNCRRWPRESFKSNLQGFFTVNSVVILLSHYVAGGLTAEVWGLVPYGLGAAVLGIIVGTRLDKVLNPESFRQLVLVLLLVLGIRLLIP